MKNLYTRKAWSGLLLVCAALIGLWAFGFVSVGRTVAQVAAAEPIGAEMGTPVALAGFGGKGDQRDADLYPALAYDEQNSRYLLVWQTTVNAGSRNDGFDVYGLFLAADGNPLSEPFRISDRNTAARSDRAAVAVGPNGFVVAWTQRGAPCRLLVQTVTDTSGVADNVLQLGGTLHQHSPQLVYNAQRDRFVIAYVDGDDYLPPTLFAASVADCGDNLNSASQIKAAEFHFENGEPLVDTQLTLSEALGGGFRPAMAYSSSLNRYLAAWEDRRAAGGEANFFAMYAQLLDGDLTATGNNIKLSNGSYYISTDSSATWTPRPIVMASATNFLTAWYERESTNDVAIWDITARLIGDTGAPQSAFQVAQMTYAQAPAGNAPTGFLSGAFNSITGEYLIGISSHTESLWGYLSSARVQRITTAGELLRLDGSSQTAAGVGQLIDLDLDDQISIVLAANEKFGLHTGYFATYGKHAPGQHSQDFNIWGGTILQGNVTPTSTPTFTATPIPTATHTPTPTPTRIPIYLPRVFR
ncbi:MAG: hypothetical protein H6645_06450 [Caldilineaceae bacterium]|nr:hypothetical protein [Caldilineaceae bacterium]